MKEFVSRTNFLDWLSSKDYIKFNNISADWDNILLESANLAESNPDYWCEVVPDKENFDSWDHLGNDLAKSYDTSRQWGYTKYNTRCWETTSKKPKLEMEWEKSIITQLPLTHASSRPTLQTPGHIMPWHQDQFIFFRRLHPEESEFIVRFLIFMKDWELGHILQAGNSIITHWQAGDVILWHPNRMHLSANIGITDKWTLNVTGVLDEQIDFELRQ